MFDERTNLSNQVMADLKAFFGDKVFSTIIPRNIRLGEAPSHGQPILLYDIKSKGAEAISASQRRSFMAQRKALGRGLSALLGTPTPEAASRFARSFGKSISTALFPTRNSHESTSTKRR